MDRDYIPAIAFYNYQEMDSDNDRLRKMGD